MSTENYGLKHVEWDDVPHDVKLAHETVGVEAGTDDGEDSWVHFMASRRKITPSDQIHTTQSRLRVDPTTTPPYTKPFNRSRAADPTTAVRVYKSEDGRDWLLDGHHRLAAARLRNHSIAAVELNHHDVDEIKSSYEED